MPPRRSHKKSRNGCDQCKSRRVKCDEANPCLNCTRRRLPCTYGRRIIALASPTGTGDDTPHESSTSSAGPAESQLPAQTNAMLDSLQRTIAVSVSLTREWSALDLELMHHFSTVTYKTLSWSKEVRKVWKRVLPKLAYSSEFLMHGILSVAGAHLAHLKPQQRSHYTTVSTFHMSLGLQTFRRVIQSPIQDNCVALFAFSFVILVWVFATPLESRDKEPIGGAIELFNLCRGVMALEGFMPFLSTSALRPLFAQDYSWPDHSIPAHTPYRMFPDLHEVTCRLRRFIDKEPLLDTEAATYHHALTELEKAFRGFDHDKKPREPGWVLVWPLGVREGFIGLVEQRRPLALILLAYYSTLLHFSRHVWFFEHQADVLLSGVTAILPEAYAIWLDWPTRQFATRMDLGHPQMPPTTNS